MLATPALTPSAKPLSSRTMLGLLPPSSWVTRFTVGAAALGHLDTGAGGAGERHHVDVGMARQRHTHTRAVAVDKVEHPGRHARGVQDLGEDVGRIRSDLRRFQDDGAAGRQRRVDLDRDLVDRPVPGRDQTADADRLLGDQRLLRVAPRTESSSARRWPWSGAPIPRKTCGPAANEGGAPISSVTASARSSARFWYSARMACNRSRRCSRVLCDQRGEGSPGGLDRHVDIGRRPQRDLPGNLLRYRVFHVESIGPQRVDPLSVDVELQVFAHQIDPFLSGWPYWVPSAYQVRNSVVLGHLLGICLRIDAHVHDGGLAARVGRAAIAGPISSSFSTYSPWQPKPSATLSMRTSLLQCTPGCGDGCVEGALVHAHLEAPLVVDAHHAHQRKLLPRSGFQLGDVEEERRIAGQQHHRALTALGHRCPDRVRQTRCRGGRSSGSR